MMNHIHILSSLFIIFSLHCYSVSSQSTAMSPAPPGPTNITAILEKAGQFTSFIRLIKNTQVADQINTQLNNSKQGLTVFVPTDNAFSSLKSGTLNSLSDQQKVQLVQFHILPNFISQTGFETVSNPLRTQAGSNDNADFPLNVTSSGNQVNVTTGVTNATMENVIFTDGQLAVYQVNQVLLPKGLFGPSAAPAPAPSKSLSDVPVSADSPSKGSDDDKTNTDVSQAVNIKHGVLTRICFGVLIIAGVSFL